jgi:phospholipid/cholesterol/gamma-HCH transport system substrate-binding protein
MTIARGAAVAALVLAIALIAFLLLRGGGGTEYKLRLETATLIVKGNDVQIGGRRVGSVDKIELTQNNQAEITFTLDSEFGQLHQGTTGIVRATSLSGIANRYIALSPGPNSAPKLAKDATIGTDQTTSPVTLDELFNTLDPGARRHLQDVINGSAQQYAGRGAQANLAAKYFSPAISTTSKLVNELDSDQQAFTDFIVNSSKVVTALSERRDQLSALVGNTNTTMRAIASENVSLRDALGRLPGTLRRANTTFVNLRATLDDLDPLVAASKPATKRLAPFLRQLRPLVAAARPTIHDLRLLIRRPGANNDLVELVRKQPALEALAGPTFSHSIAAAKQSQPVVDFIRPYAPELVGWFRDFGQGASNYDANGHFARIAPQFNAFSFTDTPAGGTLTPVAPSQRVPGLEVGKLPRCPGAASQFPPDGSAPFLDDGNLQPGRDCDPTITLPGP